MPAADTTFEEHRPELSRLAYRMLGSRADADDVMQEAYLRWSQVDQTQVRMPRTYLGSLVTRLCIDQHRSLSARRENYVGPWLPEPIVEPANSPEAPMEVAESVSLAMMVVLESLSPQERAAYLLRRVLDYSYAEIAEILAKSEDSCRQLVSRAEAHIRQRKPRYDATREEAARVTQAFVEACASGDLQGLLGVLAVDAVVYSDGGGKATAARAPIHGAQHISRFFLGLMRKAPAGTEVLAVTINGSPGLLAKTGDRIQNVMTFEIVDGRIAKCFIIRNPDKLARVPIVGR